MKVEIREVKPVPVPREVVVTMTTMEGEALRNDLNNRFVTVGTSLNSLRVQLNDTLQGAN